MTLPDLNPSAAQKLLTEPNNDRCLVGYLDDGNVILLRDMWVSLTFDQALDLILTGSSPYYSVVCDHRGWGMEVKQGLIFDLASIPWYVRWIIPRDRIPETSAGHDAGYAELKRRQRLKVYSRRFLNPFRYLHDRIFRRHLKTQQPSVPALLQRLMYRAVRLFGWRARKGVPQHEK